MFSGAVRSNLEGMGPLVPSVLGGTACGLWITTCGRARARDREDKHSWIQAFKASGKYFHAKVALLEVPWQPSGTYFPLFCFKGSRLQFNQPPKKGYPYGKVTGPLSPKP